MRGVVLVRAGAVRCVDQAGVCPLSRLCAALTDRDVEFTLGYLKRYGASYGLQWSAVLYVVLVRAWCDGGVGVLCVCGAVRASWCVSVVVGYSISAVRCCTCCV